MSASDLPLNFTRAPLFGLLTLGGLLGFFGLRKLKK